MSGPQQELTSMTSLNIIAAIRTDSRLFAAIRGYSRLKIPPALRRDTRQARAPCQKRSESNSQTADRWPAIRRLFGCKPILISRPPYEIHSLAFQHRLGTPASGTQHGTRNTQHPIRHSIPHPQCPNSIQFHNPNRVANHSEKSHDWLQSET
jgi:hypothetical protein